jgi:hypothetical protein
MPKTAHGDRNYRIRGTKHIIQVGGCQHKTKEGMLITCTGQHPQPWTNASLTLTWLWRSTITTATCDVTSTRHTGSPQCRRVPPLPRASRSVGTRKGGVGTRILSRKVQGEGTGASTANRRVRHHRRVQQLVSAVTTATVEQQAGSGVALPAAAGHSRTIPTKVIEHTQNEDTARHVHRRSLLMRPKATMRGMQTCTREEQQHRFPHRAAGTSNPQQLRAMPGTPVRSPGTHTHM